MMHKLAVRHWYVYLSTVKFWVQKVGQIGECYCLSSLRSDTCKFNHGHSCRQIERKNKNLKKWFSRNGNRKLTYIALGKITEITFPLDWDFRPIFFIFTQPRMSACRGLLSSRINLARGKQQMGNHPCRTSGCIPARHIDQLYRLFVKLGRRDNSDVAIKEIIKYAAVSEESHL